MALFHIGGAAIDTAVELEREGRPISWLGAAPGLIEANRWWMEPHFLRADDTWALNWRSWIVRVDDKTVVIDPCSGNDRSNSTSMFDMIDTPYLERFEATGTRVEDVDYVFCTHLHHDHCGWNTMLRDGRWVPTFPKARYLFVRREYERWLPANVGHYQHLPYNDGVYERSIAPIVEAVLADLELADHRLTASLSIEAGFGHTAGHCMMRLKSGGRSAIFSGDAIHHPLQLVDPQIRFGDHDDWEAVVATRRKLARESLDRDLLLIPAHLPFPHAGWMRDGDHGLWFEPLICASNV